MKPKKVLKALEKMYPEKILELDDDCENVIEKTMKTRVCGGEIYSDETYHVTEVTRTHFCTLEFAMKMIAPTKKPSPLKIYGKKVSV